LHNPEADFAGWVGCRNGYRSAVYSWNPRQPAIVGFVVVIRLAAVAAIILSIVCARAQRPAFLIASDDLRIA
jgi:hypothetical protein